MRLSKKNLEKFGAGLSGCPQERLHTLDSTEQLFTVTAACLLVLNQQTDRYLLDNELASKGAFTKRLAKHWEDHWMMPHAQTYLELNETE
ncbi:MAG: hypothetical protein JRJ03_14375 [Deltaproteobacteria bacterium]|nr:hypothetical protein [Deltaproteobacteria bacterium]